MSSRSPSPTFRHVKAVAEKMGATVSIYEGRHTTVSIFAPPGKQWGYDEHTISVSWRKGEEGWQEWRDKELAYALDRLCEGFYDCPDDCECRDDF